MKEKKKMPVLLNLFLSFLKIGLFTFGGGYGMISIIENEFVSKKQWMPKEEFLDMLAIAESTPGPIAINSATYIGYRYGKFFGALLSTIAVCIPSFVIIFVISLFFDRFLEFKYVEYAFRGIQVCVIYLIISAGIKLFKSLDKTPLSIFVLIAVIVAFVCISIFALNFSAIFLILISGGIGIMLYLIGLIKNRRAKK